MTAIKALDNPVTAGWISPQLRERGLTFGDLGGMAVNVPVDFPLTPPFQSIREQLSFGHVVYVWHGIDPAIKSRATPRDVISPEASRTQLRSEEDLTRKILKNQTMLEEKLADVEKKLADVANRALHESPREVRKISDKQAKVEIKAYFETNHGKVLYPDDIAEALGIDVTQAIDACEILAEEGGIGKEKNDA